MENTTEMKEGWIRAREQMLRWGYRPSCKYLGEVDGACRGPRVAHGVYSLALGVGEVSCQISTEKMRVSGKVPSTREPRPFIQKSSTETKLLCAEGGGISWELMCIKKSWFFKNLNKKSSLLSPSWPGHWNQPHTVTQRWILLKRAIMWLLALQVGFDRAGCSAKKRTGKLLITNVLRRTEGRVTRAFCFTCSAYSVLPVNRCSKQPPSCFSSVSSWRLNHTRPPPVPVLVSGWVTSLRISSFSDDRSSRTMSAGSVSLFLAKKPAAL